MQRTDQSRRVRVRLCKLATSVILATSVLLPASARAQISDTVVRIGVLGDMGGQFADIGGKGSVVAAQLAAEDFGGKVAGVPIEIIAGDHQNKADIGGATLRKWFDEGGVDAVADLPVSSVALAAQEIARERKKTLLISGAAVSDLTGKACSPYSTHWADDTYALANATGRAVTAAGGKTWFFLTVDYSFGHAMERDASAAVTAAGGKVLGATRHPLGTADFSSFLIQAQASKAEVVGLANVGGDTTNSIKQAAEFGITSGGQKVAGFLVFITDVHAIGLPLAKGLRVTTGFYWDQNDKARAFAKRFFAKMGRMPTKQQASVYASITHYLSAVAASGTDEAGKVNAEMRRLPVDYFGHAASIRADGRVLYDLTLYEVKSPAESKAPWDYYKPVTTLPAAEVFRPAGETGCLLGKS
ncbi:ABC transporter substrate-binding protein [Xanthobacter dioxanivorans]|uniref:ABC transporter substrate-binding protein n=1 Tax=Xanthobacter dioxanivorans TaxID=2528964 RepID=A0A974PPH3_9HYPH|nr:ABC transporter substrate-binding protein [Xanthobacter dioxanivorans]QRG07008.1 ABC transporter substrate-binding protein [Xanthobacter dioxanivorans]